MMRRDLTGKQFGTVTVLAHAGVDRRGHRWRCQCGFCGAEFVAYHSKLLRRGQQSCGCQQGARGWVIKDLTGQPFGLLTVLRQAPSEPSGHKRWICLCVCGREKPIRGSNLLSGYTESCGCQMGRSRKLKYTTYLPPSAAPV